MIWSTNWLLVRGSVGTTGRSRHAAASESVATAAAMSLKCMWWLPGATHSKRCACAEHAPHASAIGDYAGIPGENRAGRRQLLGAAANSVFELTKDGSPTLEVGLGDLAGGGVPLAGAVVERGGFAVVVGDGGVLGADARLVVARVVAAFDEQVGDGDGVAVVLIGAGDRGLHPFDAHVVNHEVARSAVGGAVAARPPELAEVGDVGVLDDGLGAGFGVVLEDLVAGVERDHVIEGHRRSVLGVGGGVLAHVLPIDVIQRAVAAANDAVSAGQAAGNDQVLDGHAVLDLEHRDLVFAVVAVGRVVDADLLVLEVPDVLAAILAA